MSGCHILRHLLRAVNYVVGTEAIRVTVR